MSTTTVTPITKHLSSDEAIERGYRLLIASLDSSEFHLFVSNQFDISSDVKRDRMRPQGRSRRCFLLSTQSYLRQRLNSTLWRPRPAAPECKPRARHKQPEAAAAPWDVRQPLQSGSEEGVTSSQ